MRKVLEQPSPSSFPPALLPARLPSSLLPSYPPQQARCRQRNRRQRTSSLSAPLKRIQKSPAAAAPQRKAKSDMRSVCPPTQPPAACRPETAYSPSSRSPGPCPHVSTPRQWRQHGQESFVGIGIAAGRAPPAHAQRARGRYSSATGVIFPRVRRSGTHPYAVVLLPPVEPRCAAARAGRGLKTGSRE